MADLLPIKLPVRAYDAEAMSEDPIRNTTAPMSRGKIRMDEDVKIFGNLLQSDVRWSKRSMDM